MRDRSDDKHSGLQLKGAGALAALEARALSGAEAIDGTFLFRVDCLCADPALALDEAIGKHVTLTLRAAATERLLDGMCASISHWPADAGLTRYQIELRPWLWWLTLASDNRIFQMKSVPDIVEAVFAAHGYADYALQLTGSYAVRDYCVQYGESDFAFVVRLLEEEGIFYFFRHEDGKHVMVLADSCDACPACPGAATVAFMPPDAGARETQAIRSGHLGQQAVSTGFKATDYAFATPATSLFAQADSGAANPGRYEYPGGYATKSAADAIVKKRVDALGAQARRLTGASDSRGMVAGHAFTLSGHERDDANVEWVLLEVQHEATHEQYRNQFAALPRTVAYRPPRATPRPRIHGAQTAVVVGKSGEEIWTDEYGRIKVQFHWDRQGKNDENSSCWVRVAQLWAGKGWGAQFIPRIGQEVVVTFLDGDPDRPLVTGCVYNGSHALPYALPAEQTKSALKSQSSKGGGGFNEIRLEDKKDAEEFYLHAQKDMKTEVLHDALRTVGNDDTIEVKEGNRKLTVAKGNQETSVSTGNDSLTVKGTRTVSVDGDETHVNKGNFAHTVDGNYTLTVKGDLTIKVSGAVTIKADGEFSNEAGTAFSNKAGTALSNEAGTALNNKAGTELNNKAGTNLTNDAGITLNNKAAASQTVDGGGMLTLKGGMVKIN